RRRDHGGHPGEQPVAARAVRIHGGAARSVLEQPAHLPAAGGAEGDSGAGSGGQPLAPAEGQAGGKGGERAVRVGMYQAWRTMTFLHWRYPPAVLQERLPGGLEIDTFDGSAWLRIAPFLLEFRL